MLCETGPRAHLLPQTKYIPKILLDKFSAKAQNEWAQLQQCKLYGMFLPGKFTQNNKTLKKDKIVVNDCKVDLLEMNLYQDWPS